LNGEPQFPINRLRYLQCHHEALVRILVVQWATTHLFDDLGLYVSEGFT
jgi:hypothetical protein